MVASFEELSLDQQVTSRTEGKSAYPSVQFEAAWFENFSRLFSPTATTVELDSATSIVNTTFKSAGRMIFDTTTSIPVWALGELATDAWVDATGVTVNTP